MIAKASAKLEKQTETKQKKLLELEEQYKYYNNMFLIKKNKNIFKILKTL